MRKIILLWLALLPPGLLAQQVDTLWSVPWLDGGIGYRPISGIFNMSTSSFVFSPGDGWDWILGEIRIKFRKEGRLADRLSILMWCSRIGSKSWDFSYAIVKVIKKWEKFSD
ncbi:MAG: acyl-CoA thioesterase, partial [Calditrichia bacterium]